MPCRSSRRSPLFRLKPSITPLHLHSLSHPRILGSDEAQAYRTTHCWLLFPSTQFHNCNVSPRPSFQSRHWLKPTNWSANVFSILPPFSRRTNVQPVSGRVQVVLRLTTLPGFGCQARSGQSGVSPACGYEREGGGRKEEEGRRTVPSLQDYVLARARLPDQTPATLPRCPLLFLGT